MDSYNPSSDVSQVIDKVADELIARLEAASDEEEAPDELLLDAGVPEHLSLAEAAAALERFKAIKDRLNDDLKLANSHITALETQRIPDLMSKAGIVHNGKGNFTTASGGKIALRNDVHVGVKKEDAPKLHSWLRERGDGSLIQEVVNAQTLKAHVKELLGQGVTIPAFVSQHVETKAVLTRGRKETSES